MNEFVNKNLLFYDKILLIQRNAARKRAAFCLYAVHSTGDDILLQSCGQIHEIIAVAADADDEIFVLLRLLLCREEIIGGMGNPVHTEARAELARQGIPCPNHRATQLIKGDYLKYDLFIGMERVNMLNMARIFGMEESPKVKKLLDFAGGGDVADPWYTDRFDVAFQDIKRGCEALLNALLKGAL